MYVIHETEKDSKYFYYYYFIILKIFSQVTTPKKNKNKQINKQLHKQKKIYSNVTIMLQCWTFSGRR